MKTIFSLCAVLVAGCGVPFEESPEEGSDVVFLEYGAWEAPPPEDVCVEAPRPVRPGPDAGQVRR